MQREVVPKTPYVYITIDFSWSSLENKKICIYAIVKKMRIKSLENINFHCVLNPIYSF